MCTAQHLVCEVAKPQSVDLKLHVSVQMHELDHTELECMTQSITLLTMLSQLVALPFAVTVTCKAQLKHLQQLPTGHPVVAGRIAVLIVHERSRTMKSCSRLTAWSFVRFCFLACELSPTAVQHPSQTLVHAMSWHA